jgi:hypothetical protein
MVWRGLGSVSMITFGISPWEEIQEKTSFICCPVWVNDPNIHIGTSMSPRHKFSYFGGNRDWTQGRTFAKQPTGATLPALLTLVFRSGLVLLCPDQSQTMNLLPVHSHSWNYSVSHHAQPTQLFFQTTVYVNKVTLSLQPTGSVQTPASKGEPHSGVAKVFVVYPSGHFVYPVISRVCSGITWKISGYPFQIHPPIKHHAKILKLPVLTTLGQITFLKRA